MSEEGHISSGAILITVMIMFYMFMGALIEKQRWVIGHEASLAIIIGMALSFGMYLLDHEELANMLTFDEKFFFYFCLPPIVFSSGYNMQRKNFFDNFNNILIFGLVNTVIQFTLFSTFTYLLMQVTTLYKYDGKTK